MTAFDEGPVALALPFGPSSAREARERLQEWLARQGQDRALIEDSRLVVSELVGNAVRHARPLADGTMIVQWSSASEGLDIAVTDGGGSTSPMVLTPGVSALAGRGMGIVETIAARWWAETVTDRRTVHALLSLP